MKKTSFIFVFFLVTNLIQSQTTRYWNGGSPSSDNIDQGNNWWGGTNPSSGDNLYFNNTPFGNRLFPYSNYGTGSYFNHIIVYNGAGLIRWRGNKTYAKKFENFDNASVFEIESEISNLGSIDFEVNPVGTGGINILANSKVTIQDGKTLNIYGSNTLEINSIIDQSNGIGKITLNNGHNPTVKLKGACTYTGLTTINGGTLILERSGGNTLNSNNDISLNGGTLRISSNQTLNNLTSTTGTLIIDNNTTLTIDGTFVKGNIIITLGGAAAKIVYGNSSTLQYNSGSSIGNEWAGTSTTVGEFTPNNVNINGGTHNLTANRGLANNFTVNLGANFTIDAGVNILVKNSVTNSGTITFENNSQLIQTNNVTNTGNITYKRTATGIDGHDYVYYSSPVSGQSLSTIYTNVSPVIPQGPIYVWNPTVANTNGGQGNWEVGSGVMAVAKGYIVRGSSDDTMAATDINTQFVGVPSNGDIPFTVSRGSITAATTGTNGVAISNLDDNHNLLGNPYPSAINALAFLQANSGTLLGNVKLWQHGIAPAAGNANFYSNFGFNYSATDYLTINFTGATTPGASDIIKAGQAFFVTMVDGAAGTGTVNFNNTMRTDAGAALDNSGFFRNAQANNSNDKNRIWVSLINAQTNTSIANTMFGYVNGATNAYDNLYDTPTKEQEFNGLFSLINNDLYEIQGKGTFNNQDIVPIAYQVANAGNYTIAINTVDGLFTGNQDIFLKDNLLNVTHNLKQNPYHFASINGVIKNRFEIVYQSTLSTENPILTDNVLVYKNENIITVKTSNEEIATVKIYDITGRKLTELNNVNSSEVTYDASLYNNQVLLVQVTTVSNKVITKKVL